MSTPKSTSPVHRRSPDTSNHTTNGDLTKPKANNWVIENGHHQHHDNGHAEEPHHGADLDKTETNGTELVKEEQPVVAIVPFTHGAAKSFAIVEVRVVIVMLYDVDTANEMFSAELFIESKWVFHSEVEKVYDVTKVGTQWNPVWKPELRISNMLVEHKSETWYKIGEIGEKKYIFEMRRIKGTFYEKLVLHNYPYDVQRLNICMFSSSPTSRCLLMKNLTKPSSVLVEHFRDSQEWVLYNYVGADENGKLSTKYSSDDVEHSTINFYCVVARRPNYFFWNAFYLIFIISFISMGTFSINYALTNSRLITINTLILTSVSFKWVINRNLPSIAYLTLLDVYSIFGISFMSALSILHSFIGFYAKTIGSTLDTYMLIGGAAFYVAFHLFVFIWLLIAVYGPRRYYTNLEKDFKKLLKKKTKEIKFFN